MRVLPYSFLKQFPNITGYKNRAEILKELKAFMLKIIDEHEERFEAVQLKDFIDVYLDQVVSCIILKWYFQRKGKDVDCYIYFKYSI